MRIIVQCPGIGIRICRQYACRIPQGGFIFFPGNELVLIHLLQHIFCAHIRIGLIARGQSSLRIIVFPGIVFVRIVGKACQHGTFPERQILQFLIEISSCRHLDPIIVFTQIDGIQVAFQNHILGHALGFRSF